MSDQTPAQILREAAQLLREKGWTRGFYECEGRYCAAGAIHMVATGVPAGDSDVARKAKRALGVGPLSFWNDDQESAETVIAAMIRAAEKLEAAA